MGYDYSRVTDRLFVGGQINDAAEVSELRVLGVTHIINAQAERDDSRLASGITILWNPTVDDGNRKPTSWFKVAVDFAIEALSRPGPIVLAHCEFGINRGPSLGYAILRAQGLSSFAALLLLRTSRPQSIARYHNDADAALRQLGWVL